MVQWLRMIVVDSYIFPYSPLHRYSYNLARLKIIFRAFHLLLNICEKLIYIYIWSRVYDLYLFHWKENKKYSQSWTRRPSRTAKWNHGRWICRTYPCRDAFRKSQVRQSSSQSHSACIRFTGNINCLVRRHTYHMVNPTFFTSYIRRFFILKQNGCVDGGLIFKVRRHDNFRTELTHHLHKWKSKLGEDQMSEGLSVHCWLAIPVTKCSIKTSLNLVIRSTSVPWSRFRETSCQWRMTLFIAMSQNVM